MTSQPCWQQLCSVSPSLALIFTFGAAVAGSSPFFIGYAFLFLILFLLHFFSSAACRGGTGLSSFCRSSQRRQARWFIRCRSGTFWFVGSIGFL